MTPKDFRKLPIVKEALKNPRSPRSILNYMYACDTSDPELRKDLSKDKIHHTTSSGRYQYLAQAIQPDQTSSRIKHAPTRPRNPIRETKNQWTNIGG